MAVNSPTHIMYLFRLKSQEVLKNEIKLRLSLLLREFISVMIHLEVSHSIQRRCKT